jgi:hypothetical protein
MMKRTFFFFVVFVMILNNSMIFAQDDDSLYDSLYLSDDSPYLSDDDIAAMEIVLPDDTSDILQENVQETAVETKGNTERNEISRINASQTIYHLLILDRIYCSSNADIGDINSREVLYKYKHGTNGYLIAIYTSPKEGPVFSQLPDGSRILVDLMTVRKSTIKDYINSSLFRRFVTNRRILLQMQNALDNN